MKIKEMKIYYNNSDSPRKRCCCNCSHNIRRGLNDNYCEVDGHNIGYLECFDCWCRRWMKDHKFDDWGGESNEIIL